jgi:hypothetical protein
MTEQNNKSYNMVQNLSTRMDKLENRSDRLIVLETKVDYIIENMSTLPPSKKCEAYHEKNDEKLKNLEDNVETKFKEYDRYQNRFIGGFIVLNIVFTLFLEKMKKALAL